MQDFEANLKQVLNHASVSDLVARYRISGSLALKIIAHRPYHSEMDILEKAVIPKRAYERLRRHLQTSANG